MSRIEELEGARIRRIDGPRPGLYALSLARVGGERCALLLSTANGGEAMLVPERPRGDAASAFVQLLRKHAANGVVVRCELGEGTVTLTIRRGEIDVALALAIDPPCVTLTVGDRTHRGPPGPTRRNASRPTTFADLVERGVQLHDAHEQALDIRADYLRILASRIAKLERRLEKIDGDAARADEAPTMRATAAAIVGQLYAIDRDARTLELTDWAAEPPRTIRIELPPGRSAKEHADLLFARARKLERGAEIASERRGLTQREIASLRALVRDVEDASADALGSLGARPELARAAARRSDDADAPTRRRAYHAFVGTGGRAIYVGKSARDNDAVTASARPWDHWLHARGVPGSHVVVSLERNETCPPELLLDAAHLAAHFSQLATESIVEVAHTPRRYVRKPKGFPPGAVRVDREKVIAVRMEPDRIERLIATKRDR
ncbi:MAG: NFACT RNA binding domain-containing protein [Sandaracinaceae bacterium]